MKRSELKNLIKPIVEELLNEMVEDKVEEVLREHSLSPASMDTDMISAIVASATKASMEVMLSEARGSSIQSSPKQQQRLFNGGESISSQAQHRRNSDFPRMQFPEYEYETEEETESPPPRQEVSERMEKIQSNLGVNGIFENVKPMQQNNNNRGGSGNIGAPESKALGDHFQRLDPNGDGGIPLNVLAALVGRK